MSYRYSTARKDDLPMSEEHKLEPLSDIDEKAKEATGERVRIEEALHASWSGVRGCCADGTPQSQVNGVFARWRADQIASHVNQRYLGSGHGGGTAKCSSSGGGGWPNPPASCRGSASVQAWIEFEKAV